MRNARTMMTLAAGCLLVTAYGPAHAGSCGNHGKATHASRTTQGSADIVDTAVAAGSFNTLAAALQAAGLVHAMKGEGPFTVFAPTDEAFAPEERGLEVERDYLNRHGEELDLQDLPQGELVVARVRVRSLSGELENVVVQNLLPSGFEVEGVRPFQDNISFFKVIRHIVYSCSLLPDTVRDDHIAGESTFIGNPSGISGFM